MQFKTIKLTGLCIALASLMTACGSSSNKGVPPDPGPGITQSNGRAIDGPLSGATVTFVDCNNATTLTNAIGNFIFPTGCSSSQLIVRGGIDTTTDLEFVGELKAPRTTDTGNNQITVSPITTLIQAAVAAGATPEAANTQIATALNLGTLNLLTTDPMQNQALYAKTVAVQHLLEQIQEVIASLGGSTTPADLNAKAFSALQAALASSPVTTDALTNTSVIAAAISNTLEAIKDDLPTNISNNLANVKTNLAAASAAVIAANVASVQTAIQNIPASAFTATGTAAIEAIKTASKAAIVAAKDSVTAQNLVDTLIPALTLAPSVVADALAQVSNAVAIGAAPSTVTTALNTIATAANIDVNTIIAVVDNPNGFYNNYLQLDGFSVQNTSFTPAQLTASLTTPLTVASVKDIVVGIKAIGSYATTANPIVTSPAISLSTGSKTVTISADKLNLSFTNGTLSAAVLPVGTVLKVTSNLNSIASVEFTLPIEKDVLTNGKIALNTATLGSLSNALATQLQSFSLAGETVSITSVIKADPYFAILRANNTPALATTYTVDLTSGAGISAKFRPQQ